MNKVQLKGKIKKIFKHTQNIKIVLHIERKAQDTIYNDYVDIIIWDNVSDNLREGTIISVEGMLRNNNYINKEGIKVYSMQVSVHKYKIHKEEEDYSQDAKDIPF